MRGPHEGSKMAQQPERPARVMRALAVVAMAVLLGATLAACGHCGDFLSSSLGQIGACHSDAPPQQ
jgi:hypothetical protein